MWWTQNRKGSAVCQRWPSGRTSMTGSLIPQALDRQVYKARPALSRTSELVRDNLSRLSFLIDGEIHQPHLAGVDRDGQRPERGHGLGMLTREPRTGKDDRVVGRNRVTLVLEENQIERRNSAVA